MSTRAIIKKLFFGCTRQWFQWRYRAVKIAKDTKIYPTAKFSFVSIDHTSKIKIGEGCKIGCFPHQYKAGFWFPTRLMITGRGANITIGDRTELNGVNIYTRNLVKIGGGCHFASGVRILGLNGHLVYRWDRLGCDESEPITIGNNVWIGLDAIILKGTEIGDNSVVAAGSVVKGKFPEFSLIGGNPAKLIKTLDKSKFQ